MAVKAPAGPQPWRSWTLADWNHALIRHFFFVKPGGDVSPITQLVVTAEEFARAAGENAGRGSEASRAFNSQVKQRLFSSRRLLGRDASEAARSWDQRTGADPPFVAHLLLTCLVASDISEERAAEGNFRKRLDQLLERRRSNHALEKLPPLWKRFSGWLCLPAQRRLESRELVLPDVGTYRIIGIPLRLSFPPRRDELRLVKLLDEEGLLGEEPPAREVLALLEARSRAFGERFRRAFEEFRNQYRAHSVSVDRSPFWSAVRGAALAGRRRESTEEGRATLLMEPNLDDDGHFRLWGLLDERAAERLPRTLATVELPEPIGVYRYALTTHHDREGSGSTDEAVDRLLGLGHNQPMRARAWRAVTTAVRQGVLMFAADDDGATSLALRLPNTAGIVDILARTDLAASLVGVLQQRHLDSTYAGWREIRGVKVADLARADFRSVPALASVRCLQETLAPAVVSMRGGIRLDGGAWLGTPGFLPSVSAPGSVGITLLKLQAGAARSRVRLEQCSPTTGTWSFPHQTGPLDGEYELSVERPTGVATSSVTFRDVVRSAEYRGPRPGKWMTEGTEDLAEVLGSLTSGPGDIVQDAPSTWCAPGVLDEPENPQRPAADRDRVEHLATALAAISLRRCGIPEVSAFEIVATTFQAEGGLTWDILRSWIEAGALSKLVSRSWRNSAYFAIPPHFVAHRAATHVRATLLGLVAPALRCEIADSAASAGVSAQLDWGAGSTFTPPLLRLKARDEGTLRSFASRAGLAEVIWLRSPEELLRTMATAINKPRGKPPRNYDVFGHWTWERRRFLRGPALEHGTISLEWMRRPDAPDYYLIRRDRQVAWWGRSRVWAIYAFAAACGRHLVSESDGGSLDCDRPGETYLPVSAARIAVALGAPPPGPVYGSAMYRYPLPSDWLRRLVIASLWPRTASVHDSGVSARMQWIEAAIRGRRSEPATEVPLAVRRAFGAVGGPEAARLSATRRVPLKLLPLLIDLARRIGAAPLN